MAADGTKPQGTNSDEKIGTKLNIILNFTIRGALIGQCFFSINLKDNSRNDHGGADW
jgi:hypothetical protein